MKLEIFKKIDDIFKFNIIRVREITAMVREGFLGFVYIRMDIYNARIRIRRTNFDGYIPIGILIKLFDE